MSDMSLDSIGLVKNTDKSSSRHDFLQLYDRLLGELRQQAISLLEIGVFGGASLRTWAEYFPAAKIVGADIDPAALQHRTDRIVVETADQSNIEDLHGLAQRHGPFDVVIDNGSHVWDHQITTLRRLFPYVKPRGFYILEDLDTSYGLHRPNYQGRGGMSAADYLRRLTDAMVGDAAIDLASESDDFIRTYATRLDYVLFSRRTSVIRRR